MTTDDLPACPPVDPRDGRPHIVSPPHRKAGSGAWFRVCCCGATAYGWTPDGATAAATEHLAAGEAHRAAEAAGNLARSHRASPEGPVGRLAGLLADDPTVKGAATGEAP